jgi:hypothetical protein
LTSTLLESHCRWKSGDFFDVGRPHLLQQAAGIRRNRLEVPALRLGIQRAEGE